MRWTTAIWRLWPRDYARATYCCMLFEYCCGWCGYLSAVELFELEVNWESVPWPAWLACRRVPGLGVLETFFSKELLPPSPVELVLPMLELTRYCCWFI